MIFGSLLAILLCFSFVTKTVASTVLDINTTDCSGQGGSDNSGNMASACNNVVDTESGTLLTAWGDAGHPVIHIITDVSDTLYLTINTPHVFVPNNTYTAVEWTTTLTNWGGWIGGGWFDCNGFWDCPTVTFAPGGESGWQGNTTASGHTDYYIVVASHCQDVSFGCYAHLTVSCSNCSVAGLAIPPSPKLTVIKQVIKDNGGTANVEDFTLKVGLTTVVNGETNTFDVGTYTITETGPAGYTSTFSGSCDSSGQITLSANDQKTCTITNDDIAPSLTLTKHVVNGNATATDWTLTATGPTSISGAGSITSGPTFSAGTYTLSESSGPNNYSSGIWNCTGATINGNSITLSLGQSVNCNITNTYIAPIPPTKKVVLIPGLGASWNTKAMLTCSEPDDTGWSLAPYASAIYSPLISRLEKNGKTVSQFNYDWRKPVQNNSNILGNNIGDEKIDIVGHSMGGLVARGYIQNSTDTSLINSLYMVGAPNQGSVLAYPAWKWGQVWNDNFIQKIAISLYLKMCGDKGPLSNNAETIQNRFPSIHDLLPTYENYLQDQKTGQVIAPNFSNDWLKALKNLPFPNNIKLGTLSGTNFSTLQIIKLKNQKSSGKIFSPNGDGTVLLSSSYLNTPNSQTINTTHSGLVASEAGILKILDFLEITEDTSQNYNYTEPNSALIVISYPSNFLLTDPQEKSHYGQSGIAAIMNPKSGSYKLNILPQSNATKLVVAQFLPNGEVKYKEYNLNGLGPKFKTLKFDLQNPQDDILIP